MVSVQRFHIRQPTPFCDMTRIGLKLHLREKASETRIYKCINEVNDLKDKSPFFNCTSVHKDQTIEAGNYQTDQNSNKGNVLGITSKSKVDALTINCHY